MAPVPNELLIELRDVFRDKFSLSELSDLCQQLGIDIESLPGTGKNDKARELSTYLGRRSRVADLLVAGPKIRDDIDWLAILSPYGYGTPAGNDANTAVTEGTIKPLDLQKLVPILSNYSGFQTPASRQSLLDINELGRAVNVNLAIGGARDVALELLLALNRRGRLAEGDTAIGRLCAYLVADDTLPSSDRDVITQLMTQYGLA